MSYPDEPVAGAYGCWKRDINERWCSKSANLTTTEFSKVRKRWQEAEDKRRKEEVERHRQAREKAERLLEESQPADPTHDYLVAKGVKPGGDLRQKDGSLVIPLRSVGGILHSLQFISSDGTKRFLQGGKIKGTYFEIPGAEDKPLVVCEGVSTGLSIAEATGQHTVCAMNATNLKAVVQALRQAHPDREIIVAADDDRQTEGNPGRTKATEAAKAVGGKLAVPEFPDGETGSDFNDIHQAQGIQAVKEQVEAAEVPTQETASVDDDSSAEANEQASDKLTFARLARLSPAEYDRAREKEADQLRIRVATLDREVAKRRLQAEETDLQGSPALFSPPEPWPEEVDGAETLSAVSESVARYVSLPNGAANAIALWVAHCHCHRAFRHTPRLNISSPEKGCGKSTLRDVVATLVPKALPVENMTSAVLFRLVQAYSPTILADECDRWLLRNEELCGLLNAGHASGGIVPRCEGDKNEIRFFRVFAPACLVGIGTLPATLHDRAVVVRLVRAKPGELKARFDSRRVGRETELCQMLARWAQDNFSKLEEIDPDMPEACHNRLADNWRPLFAIAQVAGGDWPAQALAAFNALTATEDRDAHGIGEMLLTDIRTVFDEIGQDRVFSETLATELAEMEGRPWPEFGRSKKPITKNKVADLLRRFGITPRTVRLGDDRAKGYLLEDFQEAFDRYLPESPSPERDTVTTPENIDQNAVFETCHPQTVSRPEKDTLANKDGHCHDVTLWEGGPGGKEMEADCI